jgi:predicted phosphoribosyltransferase
MTIIGISSLVRELFHHGEVVGALGQGGLALLPNRAVMETPELERRLAAAERTLPPPPEVSGREVLLVDDGDYCSQTAVVAVAALRELGAERVILAAPSSLLGELHEVVDGVMALDRPASPAAPTASAMSPRM